MKREVYSCDICKNEYEKDKIRIETRIQIIFTTEQTEGRGVSPYLTDKKIDICDVCFERILNGQAVFANGAQGCNTYYFREAL